MTIPFTCPHCGTQTDAYEQYAGQSGPCAVCGRTVTVPYPSTATLSSAASPDSTSSADKPRRRRSSSSVLIVVTVIVACLLGAGMLVGLLFALVFPAISAARQSAQKTQSASNMKLIAAAMLSYEADHGCFPPAYIADENGKPMHSWRVLLLPYLGYDHVRDQYDFNQPWDSPQNMGVRYMMPAEYACPADPDAKLQYETSYVVIVGEKTMFPGEDCTTQDDIADGTAYTIILAQTPSCGICWLEPKDLNADRMRFEINGREGVEIGSVHPDGAHVMTADGESHFLAEDTPPDYVQAMTTVAGNEPIPWYALE